MAFHLGTTRGVPRRSRWLAPLPADAGLQAAGLAAEGTRRRLAAARHLRAELHHARTVFLPVLAGFPRAAWAETARAPFLGPPQRFWDSRESQKCFWD